MVKAMIPRGLAGAYCLVLAALCAPASAQYAYPPDVQAEMSRPEPSAYASVPNPNGLVQPDGAILEPAPSAGPQNPWLPPSPDLPGGQTASCCCENCGVGANCPDYWYFDSGVRILSRNGPRFAPLVYAASDEYGETKWGVFSTRSLAYGIAPGSTMTLGRYLGRTANNYDGFEEISYWGLNEWHNTQYVDSSHGLPITTGETTTWVGNLFTPFYAGNPDAPEEVDGGIGGFNRVNKVRFDVLHSVHNVELNFWLRPRSRADRLVLQENGRWERQCQPGCYWSHMVGFRAMSIKDDFDLYTWGLATVDDVGTPVWGNYDVGTHNTLLGFQVGGDLTFRNCRWSWGTRYRVAPLINLADQTSTIVSDATADPIADLGNFNMRGYAEDNVAAVAIELGFMGSYRLLPNCVVHAAYDLIWVSGVALAPEQMDFTLHPSPVYDAPPGLNTGGTLFYQGLTLSTEFTW